MSIGVARRLSPMCGVGGLHRPVAAAGVLSAGRRGSVRELSKMFIGSRRCGLELCGANKKKRVRTAEMETTPVWGGILRS